MTLRRRLRINRAKWCWTHKRPLWHWMEDDTYFVMCFGHFRASFPLKQSVYKWRVDYGKTAFYGR